MKRAILLISILWMGSIALDHLFSDRIPSGQMTFMRMSITQQRICDYVQLNHKAPVKLSDLPPESPDRDGSVIDGWGRPLLYEQQSDNSVILTSMGPSDRSEIRFLRFWLIPDQLGYGISTFEEMDIIEKCIRTFAKEHECFPTSLSNLPDVNKVMVDLGEGTENRLIKYDSSADGMVTLSIYSKDGKPSLLYKFKVILGNKF